MHDPSSMCRAGCAAARAARVAAACLALAAGTTLAAGAGQASAVTLGEWVESHSPNVREAPPASTLRAERAEAKAAKVARQIKSKRAFRTKRARIKAAHDWLARNVSYKVDMKRHTHEAYGALVAGKAQCSGYARAFALICSKLGYRCVYLSGTARGKGGWGSHAWNKVRYAGSWKYVDVTFDDTSKLRHRYFLKSAKAFKRDHRW